MRNSALVSARLTPEAIPVALPRRLEERRQVLRRSLQFSTSSPRTACARSRTVYRLAPWWPGTPPASKAPPCACRIEEGPTATTPLPGAGKVYY